MQPALLVAAIESAYFPHLDLYIFDKRIRGAIAAYLVTDRPKISRASVEWRCV